MGPIASGAYISKNAFAQSKSEIYDYLNLKLTDIHNTYSQKIEMLSNFMMLAQDEIRDLKSTKTDGMLKHEEMKLLIDARDKNLRDGLQSAVKQIKQVSESMRQQSSCVLQMKSQLTDTKCEMERIEQGSISQDKLTVMEQQIYQVETLFHDRLNEHMRSVQAEMKERKVDGQSNDAANPAMQEVVKQISMLALSLQNFERENI